MKKHIILIDDDSDDLNNFMEALNRLPGSFKCTYATCPAKGLNMLQYLQPDYIFVDYNLPVMNGVDVLKEIKNDMRFVDTPAFLCTSQLNERIRNSAMAAGAADCFQKPTNVGEMTVILRNLLTPLEYPTYFLYQQEKISPEMRFGRSGTGFYPPH